MTKLFGCMYLIILLAMPCVIHAQAPAASWTRVLDANQSDENPAKVLVDDHNNVFTLSSVKRSTTEYDYMTIKYNSAGVRTAIDTMDPGGIDNILHADYKNGYVYVTGKSKQGAYYRVVTEKLDTSLTRMWTATYNVGVSQNDAGIRVKAGTNDTIFVAANVKYTSTNPNIRILKYYPNGTGITSSTDIDVDGLGDDDYVADMAIDQSNNVYVAGWIDKTTTFDWFVMKIKSNLDVAWTKIYPQISNVQIDDMRIAVDTSGNVYSNAIGTSSAGSIVLVYKASDGTPLDTIKWVKNGGGVYTRGFRVRNSDKSFYIADVAVDYSTTYTGKFTNSGSQWASSWDATYKPDSKLYATFALVVDDNGNAFVGGDQYASGNAASADNFLVKYNSSDGSLAWSTAFDGVMSGEEDNLSEMIGDHGGNIYLFGRTRISLYVATKELQLTKVSVGGSFTQSASIGGLGQTGEEDLTRDYTLMQNFPNPFNPTTTIIFSLKKSDTISLVVYDIEGRIVATLLENEYYESGPHQVKFDGSKLASGTYFYKITGSLDVNQTKKMLFVK